jgi:hypothetical protein
LIVPLFVNVPVDVTVRARTSKVEPTGIVHAGVTVKLQDPPNVNPSAPLKTSEFATVAVGVPIVA